MICRPMRVIARNTLVGFWSDHPETKAALERWLEHDESCSLDIHG